MDLVFILRVSYLAAAALILFAYAVPAFRSRFLAYGPRSSWPTSSQKIQPGKQPQKSSFLATILDTAAKARVPHNWFASFYAVSVAGSVLWATEMVRHGRTVDTTKFTPVESGSMTLDQIMVAWILFFVHGIRRLYESLSLPSSSKSEMWLGHWGLGILFYMSMSIAVWIEGISTLYTHKLTYNSFKLKGPSPRTFIAVVMFILASGFQNDIHNYLASLKIKKSATKDKAAREYQLPDHDAFTLSLTPHYFAECVIYLALAIQAAPQGAWLNVTLVCALVFVVVNLGVTAQETKNWYKEKFGPEAVKGKSRMIPYVY